MRPVLAVNLAIVHAWHAPTLVVVLHASEEVGVVKFGDIKILGLLNYFLKRDLLTKLLEYLDRNMTILKINNRIGIKEGHQLLLHLLLSGAQHLIRDLIILLVLLGPLAIPQHLNRFVSFFDDTF